MSAQTPSHSYADCVLADARAPACLLDGTDLAANAEGLARCDILIRAGRIATIAPPGVLRDAAPVIAMDGGLVLPRLVDIHTHLDKGQIWARAANPNGTHMGARTNASADRAARWTPNDLRARMDFELRCAYAHGTAALRTHIDSYAPQAAITWPVFAEMREAWKGRIDLQAVALLPVDVTLNDPPHFRALVEMVAHHGGLLGGLSWLGGLPDERSNRALELVFDAASAHGLDLDFHVDETSAQEARSLGAIANMALRKRFKGNVVAGHCCSLALASEQESREIISHVGEAGVAVVALPMCNMYLQDRAGGRTPRWRGVAPLHELNAAGVATMIASDNTRDPFYAYGDLDMLEVWREGTRILQFDHSALDWIKTISTTPGRVMRLDGAGEMRIGGPADLILTRARSFNELNARPQTDRIVLVKGQAIDTRPPDYRELDAIVGAPA